MNFHQNLSSTGGLTLSKLSAVIALVLIQALARSQEAAPILLSQPLSQTVNHLSNATFTVTGTGTPPLAYQWQHDGTDLAGATSSLLVIARVQPSDSGLYTVEVTNNFGAVTSAPALLTIGGLVPVIVSGFQDTLMRCGDSITFQVQAKGPTPVSRLSYQWFFQNRPIDSGTTSSLALTNLTPAQSGEYSVTVSNNFGQTNVSAVLTVVGESPVVVSPWTATAQQGVPFRYDIQATLSPIYYSALYLPDGLSLNPANGTISGTPLESGTFGAILSVANACTNGTATLTINISSAAPALVTPATATATEGAPFQYRVVASGLNLKFAASDLPPGLVLDPSSGLISGTPVLAGEYIASISATNRWGIDTANMRFRVVNAPVTGLSIGYLNYTYSAPYVLDFSFSLLDDNDPTVGNGIIADPSELSVIGYEDGAPISASETGVFISGPSRKVIKAYLVLDFTESIASLANGDSNQDGISDAVESMVSGAEAFVNQQSIDTQIGVSEFHREDVAPSNVVALTSEQALVDQGIAGIWTNSVQGFPAGSRCWDALMGAIAGLGASNRDEQHYVILVSDGQDESSTSSLGDVIAAATAANVQVFIVGFGAELAPNTLQTLAAQTQGRYYPAQNPSDIARQFAQISKMARGQYILRWATLKRAATPFMPSFQIGYHGFIAGSPTNPFTLGDTNVDATVDPPVTNIIPASTNFIIGYFETASNAAPVLTGSLRLVPNAEISPTGVDLRVTYVPRYIRQLRLHYRSNWPCTAKLQSNGPGELLNGWSLEQSADGTGGNWLLLSSPQPQELTSSLPFASFGKLLTFAFQDPISSSNAFSLFQVDNTIYESTGGQSFVLENTNDFLTFYPTLPHGTPVPWLTSYGITNDLSQAENLDSDHDGVPNWLEFRANTNPTNSASAFVLRRMSRLADGRFQVSFSTSTNRLYRLEASNDLSQWRSVNDAIPGTSSDVTLVDTTYVPDSGRIFYRVVVY